MADVVKLLEFPLKGVLSRTYTSRLWRCIKCGDDKPHTAENFRACEEIRNGAPYHYIKKKCRSCEHIARVEYGKKHADRQNRNRRMAPNKFANYRKHNLKKAYGLTVEQYDVLLESQGGKCAICRADNNGIAVSGRQIHFAVDHDHNTGRVRGLLCTKCNHGLGEFRDNVERLHAAIQYLERHK